VVSYHRADLPELGRRLAETGRAVHPGLWLTAGVAVAAAEPPATPAARLLLLCTGNSAPARPRPGWRRGHLSAFRELAAEVETPGPASTQLAIFRAWRRRGRVGALAGGVAFIIPGLIVILALAVLFLSTSPPLWVLGAGAGAGAAVPAVAIHAGAGLTGAD
jgi:hypothetical protein